MTDGVATITVTFPFSDEYKNASMTLTVNGEEIPFDLENFRNNAQSVVVGSNPTSAEIVVIKGNSSAVSVIGDMKTYLDGVEITEAQLKEMNPDTIGSIEVNNETHVLRITSKKGKLFSMPQSWEIRSREIASPFLSGKESAANVRPPSFTTIGAIRACNLRG